MADSSVPWAHHVRTSGCGRLRFSFSLKSQRINASSDSFQMSNPDYIEVCTRQPHFFFLFFFFPHSESCAPFLFGGAWFQAQGWCGSRFCLLFLWLSAHRPGGDRITVLRPFPGRPGAIVGSQPGAPAIFFFFLASLIGY